MMAGHGSPPPEDRANHPARRVGPDYSPGGGLESSMRQGQRDIRIEQAHTINPGPLVGTQSKPIPDMYNVRKPSPFGGDYYMGSIRKSDSFPGRWTGIMAGHPGGGDTPAFNVRTEHRARVAATALAGMSTGEAIRRSQGLRSSFERRYNKQRGT